MRLCWHDYTKWIMVQATYESTGFWKRETKTWTAVRLARKCRKCDKIQLKAI